MLISDIWGVQEYAEGFVARLQYDAEERRLVVVASNECGFNEAAIDLLASVRWLQSGRTGDPINFHPESREEASYIEST